MSGYPFWILDVFTDTALAGNQLAVFRDAAAIPEARLQPLAREMGFSETVFVFAPQGDETARVRIFTPENEIPFAGHPVLGTAVALAITHGLDRVDLLTPQGRVPLWITNRTRWSAFGRMQQPLPTVAPLSDPAALLAALRIHASEMPIEVYDNGLPNVYVALPDEESVTALDPDFGALTTFARGAGMPTVGINCFAGSGRQWKTRMFAPADGVPEDPATGSAAGPLACHLARHGRIGFGDEIAITQGVEIGRPSTLYATAHGSPGVVTRIEVAGAAVLVASGSFDLASDTVHIPGPPDLPAAE